MTPEHPSSADATIALAAMGSKGNLLILLPDAFRLPFLSSAPSAYNSSNDLTSASFGGGSMNGKSRMLSTFAWPSAEEPHPRGWLEATPG